MIGFVYEADQDAIKEAQDRVDQLRHDELIQKIDDAITAIEDNKKNDNIYDFAGSSVIKDITADDTLKLYNMIHDTTALDNLLADKVFTDLKDPVSNLSSSSIVVQIGDIHLDRVQNVDDLAQSIVNELPNRITQLLYKR